MIVLYIRASVVPCSQSIVCHRRCPLYQVRKKLIRLLPTGFSTVLAIFKKTLFRFLFQIKDKLA